MKSITPQEEDLPFILINRAEMQYDQGFGRRYYRLAAKSLWLAAKTSASLCKDLLLGRVQVRKAETTSSCLFIKSSWLAIKAFTLSVITYVLSLILDPIKRLQESHEKKKHPKGRTAILIIDAQNDFTVAGSQLVDGHHVVYDEGKLGVAGGYEVVNPINALIRKCKKDHIIAASLDWHPPKHKSFSSNTPATKPHDTIILNGTEQHLWPEHCVQGTSGAQFLPGLQTDRIDFVIRKGQDLFVDSYSAFFDNNGQNKTTLDEYLQSKNISTVIVVGIATDFCVKYTALDAQRLGYKVKVILDACRGVDINNSIEKALEELKRSRGSPERPLEPIQVITLEAFYRDTL